MAAPASSTSTYRPWGSLPASSSFIQLPKPDKRIKKALRGIAQKAAKIGVIGVEILSETNNALLGLLREELKQKIGGVQEKPFTEIPLSPEIDSSSEWRDCLKKIIDVTGEMAICARSFQMPMLLASSTPHSRVNILETEKFAKMMSDVYVVNSGHRLYAPGEGMVAERVQDGLLIVALKINPEGKLVATGMAHYNKTDRLSPKLLLQEMCSKQSHARVEVFISGHPTTQKNGDLVELGLMIQGFPHVSVKHVYLNSAKLPEEYNEHPDIGAVMELIGFNLTVGVTASGQIGITPEYVGGRRYLPAIHQLLKLCLNGNPVFIKDPIEKMHARDPTGELFISMIADLKFILALDGELAKRPSIARLKMGIIVFLIEFSRAFPTMQTEVDNEN